MRMHWAIALVIVLVSSGCLGEPKLDTETQSRFQTSVAKMKSKLSYAEKLELDEAIVTSALSIQGANGGYVALSFDPICYLDNAINCMLPELSEALDGQTASNVLDSHRALEYHSDYDLERRLQRQLNQQMRDRESLNLKGFDAAKIDKAIELEAEIEQTEDFIWKAKRTREKLESFL